MVAARSSLPLAASIYTAAAGTGQGRQLPARPAQMLPPPLARSWGAPGTGLDGSAAALGRLVSET